MKNDLKKVAIVGLGPMGTALTRTLLKKDYPVAVWNRTRSRAEALMGEGAVAHEGLAETIDYAEVVLVSVADYAASDSLLLYAEVMQALKGKVLIQLSTGTPKDARDAQAWTLANGTEYLDGAIMVTPSQMGTDEAMIFLSGDELVYEKARDVLEVLSPNLFFAGAEIGIASALDLAVLSYFFGALIGFTHAAHICRSEGYDIKAFSALAKSWTPAMGTIMEAGGDMIVAGNYDATESTMKTCYTSMMLVSRQAGEKNLNPMFPSFATSLFKAGMDSGLANEDGIAIFKVLQERGKIFE